MLRILIAVLVFANLAFWGWTSGWLDGLTGLRADGDREPERLQRQFHPERVQLLAANASPPAPASAASAAVACLEAGPYADNELPAAQKALQAVLPAGSWSTVKAEQPAVWVVVLGRFTDAAALARREDELKRRNLSYEVLTEPEALAPGLALGRYEDRNAASQALEQFGRSGVRNARVAELSAAGVTNRLRIDKADAATAALVQRLDAAALGSRSFTPCQRAG